jgi:predicted RNA-binding Zn-ribbon protein involved in translation (DUF1610 family)
MWKLRDKKCPVCQEADLLRNVRGKWLGFNFQFSCPGCGSLLRIDTRLWVGGFIAAEVIFVCLLAWAAIRPSRMPIYLIIAPGLIAAVANLLMPISTWVVLKSRGPHCQKCRYNLHGVDLLEHPTCPECGDAVPLAWIDKLGEAKQ